MKPIAEKSHSRIGASGMYRWAECPGSVKLSAGITAPSSYYAAEGTVAHDLAEACLTSKVPADKYLGTVRVHDGHEIAITEEMCDAVDDYCRIIRGAMVEGDELYVEHKFDLSSLHPGLFGTADAVVWGAKDRTLHVFDFKYGAGVMVDVNDNPQLRYYGLGALITLKLPATKVVLHIIQPRVGEPHRFQEIDAIDMLDFKVDLIQFAKATEDPHAALKSGEHCKFCPAAGVCPLLHEQALAAAKTVFSPAAPYDPAQLADALRLAPVLKAWASSVTEFAYAEAEQGRCPPGYKLVAKRANRKWRDEQAAIQALRKAGLGEPELYGEPSLKSPAAIEKHLGKKEFVAVAGDLVVSESSGHTFAPLDDKRPPVKPTAQDAFKPVTN
jgi:hypothetical protein